MKYLLQIAIFLIASTTFAQIQLRGTVKDADGNLLEMANLIAINSQTKKLDSYGFSDAFGNYKLNLKQHSSYTIKASYVGMKTGEISVKIQDKSIIKNIVLEVDNTLDEVEIIARMPVKVVGDTIVYNADSFKSGTEKKLGDVLKKLPGVEVNDEGEIKVEGKTVKKVMVEGKDFFDGDSKLATKNIPADAVDKVEVLKNHSEVSQMSRVADNQDNIVVNIKLKEGKKRFWFGEVTARLGMFREDKRYLAHPKLFYYSPKVSVNIITDFNNIGKTPFTMRDYFKFTGGFRGVGGKGTNFNTSSSDIGFLTLKNNKAKEIISRFGAVNFSYSPSKKWNLSGFGIYSGNTTDLEEKTIKNYINLNTDVTLDNSQSNKIISTESTQSVVNQKSNLGLLKLSSSYKPHSNKQLDYDAFVKLSKMNQQKKFQSVRNYLNADVEEVPIDEFSEKNPFSIHQNINYYYTLNDNHIFAFEGQYLWQSENPFYNAELSKLSFVNQLGLNLLPLYNVSQSKRIRTHKIDIKVDYYYVLTPKSNLNFTAGATLSNQQFNSSIFEKLASKYQQIKKTSTINDVAFSFSDYFTGLHYKFMSGIFTFSQGVTLHKYATKNTQLNTLVSGNFVKLLPNTSVKVNLKKSETLRLKYSQEVDFTDVHKVAQGYVFNNYNSLYSGNRALESSLSHNINISYSSYSMFNYTDVFARINYNKYIDKLTRLTQFEGVEQVSTSVNSVFPDETLSVNTSLGKSFRRYKLRFGGNIVYSIFNNLFYSKLSNTTINRLSKSLGQTYNARFSSNFKNAFNFDIGYKIELNTYHQAGIKDTFTTHSPFLNLNMFITDEVIFDTEFTYNNYKNGQKTINNYSFWDASLSYQKKNSNWEYLINATNILNTKSLNKNYSNSIVNATSQYLIQERYVTLGIKYKL